MFCLKKSAITVIVLLYIVLTNQFVQKSFASADIEGIRKLYDTPIHRKAVAWYFENHTYSENRANISKTLALLKKLPNNKIDADKLVSDYLKIQTIWCDFIYKKVAISDENFRLLEAVSQDESMIDVARYQASLLCYFQSNNIAYLRRSFDVFPQGISLFSVIKDDRVAPILQSIIAEAVSEQFTEKSWEQSPVRKNVAKGYAAIICALYGQDRGNSSACEWLFYNFNQFRIYPDISGHLPGGYANLDPCQIIAELKPKPFGDNAAQQFIRSLIKLRLKEDIENILAKYPEYRPMVLAAAKDEIDNMRALRLQLDRVGDSK